MVIASVCLAVQSGWAAKAYITDSMKITLRTGPSTQNKIIAMIASGQPVEILESQSDWTKIQVLENRVEKREGWVLSRYLIHRLPWEKQVHLLLKENNELKEKLPVVKTQLNESLQRIKELESELGKTKKNLSLMEQGYNTLKQGAAGYIKLKESNEVTKSALSKLQESAQILTEENRILRSSQNVKWFLAGALVLLFGLIIGLVTGKKQKKQRSMLQM